MALDTQPAVRKVFEIVKALPPERIFASEAEFDASLEARPPTGISDTGRR